MTQPSNARLHPPANSNTRTRVLLMTLLPIALIFTSILGVALMTMTRQTKQLAETEMATLTGHLASRFDLELRRVARVAEMNATFINNQAALSEESLFRLLEEAIREDALIYGAAIGYVDRGFDDRRRYCPYVYRDPEAPGGLARLDIGEVYDYQGDPAWEWWHQAVQTGKPFWTQPYFDEGAGNIMMTTYSVPFYRDGKLRGVTTVDIPLEPLRDFIQTNLAFAILTDKGRYVYHGGEKAKAYRSIYAFCEAMGRPDIIEVADRMTAGEQGMAEILDPNDDVRDWLFYAPIPSASWSIGVYLPRSKAMAELHRLVWWMGLNLLISLALIAGALWWVSGMIARTQGDLETREHQFRTLVTNIPGVTYRCLLDDDWTMLFISDAIHELTGHAPEAYLRGEKTFADAIHPDDRDWVAREVESAVHKNEAYTLEYRIVHRNGQVRWVRERGQSSSLSDEGPMHLDGAIFDITERKLSEERFKGLLESAPDAMVIADQNGLIIMVNQQTEKLFGYDRDELIGHPVEMLLPDALRGAHFKHRDKYVRNPTLRNMGAGMELSAQHKDGSQIPIEVSLSPMRTDDGLLVSSAIRDITDRKKAADDLRKARDEAESANRAKSAFLANMSHELRTPMNAIIGYSEMLIEESEDLEPDEFVPDLEKIHGAGKHLLALINDILDLSKIEAGKMELFQETFDVAGMLDEITATVDTLIKKNGNTLIIERDDDLGTIHADLTKVRQSLFNLLSNAAKFTDQGQITLSTHRDTDDEGKAWIAFGVKDSGIGIASDKLDHLFDEFTQADASTTRQYGGTGLGLAITRRFSLMMGGTIEVTSEVGKGSMFVIRIPVEGVPKLDTPAKPATVAEAVGEASSTATRRGTVLIVDDETNNRELLHRYLDKDGFSVLMAEDGEAALRLAKEKQPDAITLDVLMPSMDGWTVLKSLKDDPETAHIPVIMATMVDDKNMGYTLGATDYLTKPIDRKRLSEILGRYRPHLTGSDVLVVEDDSKTRDILRRTLEGDEYLVREATNGQDALRALDERPPDLILLDLMMPVMDGFEFLAAMRADPQHQTIPVLVVTAKDLTEHERNTLRGGVELILQKGAYSRETLLERVRQLINHAPAASATETDHA